MFPDRSSRLDAESMLTTEVMGTSVAYALVPPGMSVQGLSQLTLRLGRFTRGSGVTNKNCPTHVPFVAHKMPLALINVDCVSAINSALF